MSCIVPMCDNVGEHRFPNDLNLRRLWLQAIDFESRAKTPLINCHRSLVCSNHFKPSDYRLSSANELQRKFLKKYAVPSIFPWSNHSTDGQDSVEATSSMETCDETEIRFVHRISPLRTFSKRSQDSKLTTPIATNSVDMLPTVTPTSNEGEQGALNEGSCCISCLCKHNQRSLHMYTIQNDPLRRMFQSDDLTLCYICRKLAWRAEKFVACVQNNQKYLAQAASELSENQDTKPNFEPLVEMTTKHLGCEDLTIKFDESPCDELPQQLTDEFEPKTYNVLEIKEEIAENNDDPLKTSNTNESNYIPQPREMNTIKMERVSDDEQTNNTTDNDDSPQDIAFPVSLIRVKKDLVTTLSQKEVDKTEVKRVPKPKRKVGKTVDGARQDNDGKTVDETSLDSVGETVDEANSSQDGMDKESATPLKRKRRSKVNYEELEEAESKRKNDKTEVPQKKTKRYTEGELKNAVDSVLNSTMTLYRASKAFNIPWSTLKDNVDKLKESREHDELEASPKQDGDEKESPIPHKRRRTKVNYEELEEVENKRKNDIYEIIKITEEQSLKELAESAKDPQFLEAPFKCMDCVRGFIMKNLYEEHMLLHEESRGDSTCIICKIRLPNQRAVAHHRRKHYFRFKCRECGFLRKGASSVIEHYQQEHRKEINVCGVCGKTLTTKKSLKRHLRFVHSSGAEDRLTCEYCNRTFKCKYILKNHLSKMHTELVSSPNFDINRHKCPYCPRGFPIASKLKRHMQQHMEFTDFYCQQCHKYFRTKESLKYHENYEPGHVYKHKKPFQCDYCGRRFARKIDIKKHIVSSHLRRIFLKCTICNKECKDKSGYAYHMRAVHGGGIQRTLRQKEQHQCDFCEKTFLGEKWLHNHIRKTHNSGYRPDGGAEDDETEAAAFYPVDVVETQYGADES